VQHRPRKRFGQNFLHEQSIIDNIITAIAVKRQQNFVEIGPGLGALTNKLLAQVERLDVIEIDRDLIKHLQQFNQANIQLTIHHSDVLDFDFKQLLHLPLRIVGNLPYNISTPLIFHLLNYIEIIDDMHFMLQKEVVERIAATPNTKNYGRLSVMLQYYCVATKLFDVPATAFKPQPKVESAMLRLTPHTKPPLKALNEALFSQIVKTAFMHPRKMLGNNLKGLISATELQNLSVNAKQRPQQLSVRHYVEIANYLAERH